MSEALIIPNASVRALADSVALQGYDANALMQDAGLHPRKLATKSQPHTCLSTSAAKLPAAIRADRQSSAATHTQAARYLRTRPQAAVMGLHKTTQL